MSVHFNPVQVEDEYVMIGEEDGLEYIMVDGDMVLRHPQAKDDEYPGYPLHNALSSGIASGSIAGKDDIAALIMSNENMTLEAADNGYLPVHVCIENEHYEYLPLVLVGRCITVEYYKEQSILNPLIFAIWRGASYKCLDKILTLFPESRTLVDSKDEQTPIHHLILNLASDEYLTKLLKRSLEVRHHKVQGTVWSCPVCTLINSMDNAQCDVCGGPNPHMGSSANSVEIVRRPKRRHADSVVSDDMEYLESASGKTILSSHRGSTYSSRGSMFSTSAMTESLACPVCTFLNPRSNRVCEMCRLDLPLVEESNPYEIEGETVSNFRAVGAGGVDGDVVIGGDLMIGESSPGGESMPPDDGIPLSRQNSLEAYKTYFTHGDTHLSRIVTLEAIDLLCTGVEMPCCEVDRLQRTPLHYAALLDTTGELIQSLLQYAPQTTAYKDENDRTPLHFASIFANVRAIQPLMACDSGALKCQDKYQAYPIDYAIYAAPVEADEADGGAVFGTLTDLIVHDEFLGKTIARLNSALQIMAKLPTDILLRGETDNNEEGGGNDEYIHPGAIVVPSPIHGSDQLSIYAGDIAKVNSVLPNGDVLINMLNGTNMNTLFTLKPIEIRVIKGEYFVDFMHRVVKELTDLSKEKLSASTIIGILVNNDVISTVENLINDKEHSDFAALKESTTAFLSFVNDNNIFKSIHNANWSKVMALSADGGASMVNSSGQYPIHIIAMLDYAHTPPMETIKGLLEAAPEAVNKRDGSNNTPMYYAVTQGSARVMQCLIECGADLLHQQVYVAQHSHNTVQIGDRVLMRPSVYETRLNNDGDGKVSALDESFTGMVCTAWDGSTADQSLIFTDNHQCCQRDGNTSCYPASLISVMGDVSLTCRLDVCGDKSNTQSFGIARDSMKLASSDGFGLEDMSFGLSDSRSQDSGAKIVASGTTVRNVRHLVQGDVLCLRYEMAVSKCWLYVYREANYPHGAPDIYHEFDIPDMKYVVGATYANNHMLRILAHQPPERGVGGFDAGVYRGVVSAIERHENRQETYAVTFPSLEEKEGEKGEKGEVIIDNLRRQDFDLTVGGEEGKDNIDYIIVDGPEDNRDHIMSDDPTEGWMMTQDDIECVFKVKVRRGVLLKRIRLQLLNEVSAVDIAIRGTLADHDNEQLFSRDVQALPVTDASPQWVEVELPEKMQTVVSNVSIRVLFNAIAGTTCRFCAFRLEGTHVGARELQTWRPAQLLNTHILPNGDKYFEVEGKQGTQIVWHEEVCYETHIYRTLKEANVRTGLEFSPVNDGGDISGTVPGGEFVQIVGRTQTIIGDKGVMVERLKRAHEDGWMTRRYVDGSHDVMEFCEIMPSPKSYLEMLLQRGGDAGGMLRAGGEGEIDILEYLFKQYKGRCGSQNALHVALKSRAASTVISKLLSLDQNLSSQTDGEGMTPMQIGILSGMDASTLQMIIDADEGCLAAIDRNEKNMLHYAVEAPCPNIDIVKAILDHTDERYVSYILGTPDKRNYLPFHYALQNQQCSLEIIHLVHDVCAEHKVEMWAGELHDTNSIEEVELFPMRAKSSKSSKERDGYDKNISLRNGAHSDGRNTMLHYAVSRPLDPELYILLEKYTRYAAVKDRLGRSPLSRAVVARQPLVVLESLLQAAPLRVDSTVQTAPTPRLTRLDPIIIESPHDYEDNVTEYKTISVPGASGYSIHFDPRCHTEERCDYIAFYTDDSHTTTFGPEKYSGKKFPGMNGEPVLHIPANAFIFHFRSDYSCHYWGYKITVMPVFDFGPEVTSVLDTSTRSPLFYACYYKASQEAVTKLLDALPDALFVPDMRGNLCLHALCAPVVGETGGATCSLEVLQEFIKRYPESVTVSNLRDQTALHYYCQNSGKLDPAIIDLLMSSKGSKDSAGYTALKYLLESMKASDYQADGSALESIMKLLRADADAAIVLFCEMLPPSNSTMPDLKQEIVVEILKKYIDSLESEDECSDIAASLAEKNGLTLLSEYAGNRDAEWILNKCRDSNIFLAIETQRWDTVVKLSPICAKNINSRTGQHPAHCIAQLGDTVPLAVMTTLLEHFPQAATVRDKVSSKLPIVYALESNASPATIDTLLKCNADFSMKTGDECFVAKHPLRQTEYLRWLPGKLIERDAESGSLSIQLEQREMVTISRDKIDSDVRCDTKVWQIVEGKVLCLLKLGDDFNEDDHYEIEEGTQVKTVGDEQMTVVRGITFRIFQRAETLGWMAWTDSKKMGDDDSGYPSLRESFLDSHPLHLAIDVGSSAEIVRTILDRCDNCASIREGGMLPLHKVMQRREAKDMVGMLLKAFPEACVEKCGGSTALHLAARNKDANAVNLLLEHGADLKAKDKDNLEPFERNDDREAADMEAFLCEAEFSEKALQAKDYSMWFTIIQQRNNRLSETQVTHYVQRTPALITATDTMGRTAQNIATPDVRNAMNATLLWFKKYQLLESRPEHISKTCHLYKAEDQTKPDRPKVALKLMSTYSQFVREKQVRRVGTLNPEFVVDIIEDYMPSKKEGDATTSDTPPPPPPNDDIGSGDDDDEGEDVKDFRHWSSSDMQLNKVQAESCFCLVMPLANRNMYVSLKQDRFAGTNMVEIGVVFQQIVQCVRHLHDKGVVHADLKPLNLVRTEYRWKLIDLDASCKIGLDHVGKKSSTAYVPPEAFYHIQSENKSKWILRSKSNIDSLEALSSQEKKRQYLLAQPSFDVWSLGCILYELCSKEVLPLFQSDRDDNISEDIDYQDNIYVLAEWQDNDKYRKLAHIKDDMARMLISQMLNRDPSKRPTLDRILQHPFISHKKPARVLGQQAEWDCFISYRKHCDEPHARKLFEALTEKGGLKTWWDVERLKAGCDWKEEFCRALLNTRTVVILISEASVRCKAQGRANFTKLTEESTDNVLLEMTLAVELMELGMVDAIIPIFIGNKKENGEFSKYFEDVGYLDKSIPDTLLKHVETDVRSLFDKNALGVPSLVRNARAVYKAVCDKQGIEVAGDYNESIRKCLADIEGAVIASKGKDGGMVGEEELGGSTPKGDGMEKKSRKDLEGEIERLRRKLSLEADKREEDKDKYEKEIAQREEEKDKYEKEIAKLKSIEGDMIQSKKSWYHSNGQEGEVTSRQSGERLWNSSKSHADRAERRASAPSLHHDLLSGKDAVFRKKE